MSRHFGQAELAGDEAGKQSVSKISQVAGFLLIAPHTCKQMICHLTKCLTYRIGRNHYRSTRYNFRPHSRVCPTISKMRQPLDSLVSGSSDVDQCLIRMMVSAQDGKASASCKTSTIN